MKFNRSDVEVYPFFLFKDITLTQLTTVLPQLMVDLHCRYNVKTYSYDISIMENGPGGRKIPSEAMEFILVTLQNTESDFTLTRTANNEWQLAQ